MAKLIFEERTKEVHKICRVSLLRLLTYLRSTQVPLVNQEITADSPELSTSSCMR